MLGTEEATDCLTKSTLDCCLAVHVLINVNYYKKIFVLWTEQLSVKQIIIVVTNNGVVQCFSDQLELLWTADTFQEQIGYHSQHFK